MHHQPAKLVRFGHLHLREQQHHLRAGRRFHAGSAKFRRHFRRPPRCAHHGQSARRVQIRSHFIHGRIEHRPRRLLAENFLINFRNFRQIAQRLCGIHARLAGNGPCLRFPSERPRCRRTLRPRLVFRLLRARRPPIRRLIQARQPRVSHLFPREHRRNLLQTLQGFALQRILQKDFRLYDQIFQGLHLPSRFWRSKRPGSCRRCSRPRSVSPGGLARFHHSAG